MNVRPAGPEDARRIAEIQVETWRDTYPGIMPQSVLDELSVDERERMWARTLDFADAALYVAEREREIVGFVGVGRSRSLSNIGELYAFYVAPGAQGAGAGLALMEVAVEWLGEQWDDAVLWVATENPRARRFYERYGWEVDGERVDDSIPGASVPETRYRLSGLGRR